LPRILEKTLMTRKSRRFSWRLTSMMTVSWLLTISTTSSPIKSIGNND
jgi:hypothetical protein